MKRLLSYAFITVIALVGLGLQSSISSPARAASAPPAVIIVIDSQLIRRESLAGKDLLRQVDIIRKGFQAEVAKKEDSLKAGEAELKRQRAILTPEAFEDKRRAFEQKYLGAQKDIKSRRAKIELAVSRANDELRRALLPIFRKVLNAKKATILMDKSQTVLVGPGLDVTTEVIEQLDQVLPAIKIDLEKASTP
jgi:Skp family chaperone for outer membrane proteins